MNNLLVGFFTGVLASILATLIFTAFKLFLNKKQTFLKIASKKGTFEIDATNVEAAASTIVQNIETPQIFLAYSSQDKEFVEKLANDLQDNGIRVWYADKEIKSGEDFSTKIEKAIRESAYYGIILSNAFLDSKWVEKELSLMLQQESKQRVFKILPILIEETEIPEEIRDRIYQSSIYADFTQSYKIGLETLLRRLKGSLDKNVEEFIEENWLDLLESRNEVRIKRRLTDLKKQIENSSEIVEILKGEPPVSPTSNFRETIDIVSIQLLTLLEHDINQNRTDLIELLAYAYNLISSPQPTYTIEHPKKIQADLWIHIITRVYLIGVQQRLK